MVELTHTSTVIKNNQLSWHIYLTEKKEMQKCSPLTHSFSLLPPILLFSVLKKIYCFVVLLVTYFCMRTLFCIVLQYLLLKSFVIFLTLLCVNTILQMSIYLCYYYSQYFVSLISVAVSGLIIISGL